MGFINRLYTFASNPAVDPAVGAQIDAELNQILNLVNGALDNLNIGGNPDIASDKLSLGNAGYLLLSGGQLTGLLEHLYSGIFRRMGASGGVLIREYRDAGAGVAWGLSYNTYYNSGWIGRDVADICMRLELSTEGMFRVYLAPSASSGVAPVWNLAQYMSPMGGTGELGDVTISGNQTQSGIYHYNNLTINNGITWTLEQGKPLIIYARESVTINGIVDGNGKGALGGAAVGIDSDSNPGANGDAGSGGSGGNYTSTGKATGVGGSSVYLGYSVLGGASRGSSGNGYNGAALTLTKRFIHDIGLPGGAGGSSGVSGGVGNGGGGGNGGGTIIIISPKITIATTGIVRANGNNGANGNHNADGGGGGGGGGLIFMQVKSYSNSGSLTVAGGSGGTNLAGTNYIGGNGGAGVTYIEELK